MQKIGTITFHRVINYGAILQTYALQKTLLDLGHDSEIIDYFNPQLSKWSFSKFRFFQHFVWHNIVKKVLVGIAREKKTDEFCQKYLNLSARKYTDLEALSSSPPIYNAYISGSDQVWNPNIINYDSAYFLDFVPIGKKRISYSASFGVSQIPARFTDRYRTLLNKIHFLSTRELEGRQIIKQLTGRNAVVTLDPTLLLDQNQWRQIAAPCEFPRPYILCYYMPGDKVVNKSITALARQVSALTGWEIICIGQKEYMKLNIFKRSIFDAGPAEYLGLFQNASFVITNSFHGTAFSINFRKPFLVPINKNMAPGKALSSRITSLLSTLKLEDRLLSASEVLPADYILDLDYQATDEILQKEKQKSIAFLVDALEAS